MRLGRLLYWACTAVALPFNINLNVNTNVNLNIDGDEMPLGVQTQELGLFPLHKKLVQTESLSFHEQEVSDFLVDYLQTLGLTVETINSNGRNNIYAYFGTTRDNTVLLTSHIDTVPPYIGYYDDGERIYGRGSCDAKASVAAQITAFSELFQEQLIHEGDVALLFVVGEETGGDGMQAVDESIKASWKHVVFGEPTENKLAIGHKGVYYFKLKVHGVSSHSGYPELGQDANNLLIKLMYQLSTTNWPRDDLLGVTNVNIGLINGGTAANVISPIAECEVLMRLSVNADQVEKIVDDIITNYQNVDITVVQKADPTYLDYDVPGFDTMLASYFTDIPNLTQNGFKRYLYGPGSILVAHGDNEYVTYESLKEAVNGYKRLVTYGLN